MSLPSKAFADDMFMDMSDMSSMMAGFQQDLNIDEVAAQVDQVTGTGDPAAFAQVLACIVLTLGITVSPFFKYLAADSVPKLVNEQGEYSDTEY